MIRALSLAAALAVLPLSTALAGEQKTPSEAAIESASAAFEARMEAFGERAEAISDDKSLSQGERERRIAALWSEYQPEVAIFTAEFTRHAGRIASEALANIDVEALVADAMNDPDVQQAMTASTVMAEGIVANGAWSSQDPEQLVTYQLMAQYALDQASDAIAAEGARAADSGDEAGQD